MKNMFAFLVLISLNFSALAQVGIGNTNPDPSSILELTSTTQGMLTPRMTEVERNLISSPATGLFIYQTDNTSGFYYYNGTIWLPFAGGASDSDWTINGNDMYNANTGNIGIGNVLPSSKFHVTGTTVPSSSGGVINTEIVNYGFESGLGSFTNDASNVTNWSSVSSEANFGSNSASVGGIANNELSKIKYTLSSPINSAATAASISFYFKTDTEDTYDFLKFYVNGLEITAFNNSDDGSGITNWTQYTYPLAPGVSYVFEWGYKKDGNAIGGSDTVWIDDVVITETTNGSPTAGSYVFRLEDGQQGDGKVLTSDADGNATWAPAGAGSNQTLSISGNDLSISGGNTVTLPTGGGGGSYTFTNALTESGGNVKLGGSLTNDTFIDLDGSYDLIFSTGDGPNHKLMSVLNDKEFVTFGNSTAAPNADFDDRSFTLTTSLGTTAYTSDVVLGYYNGTTGGSAFKMGSIEYLVDGGAELFLDGAASLSPFYGNFSFADLGTLDIINSYDGGSNTGEWEDIYATNFVTVSDRRTKDNIKDISYGLEEILKLKPVSFDYNKQLKKQKKYNISSNLMKQKLGFIAQDVEKILPEVVKTHDWKVTDEASRTVEYLENNIYGIMYSDIVPVTVKAIQEQQLQIKNQDKKIKNLESEISQLKNLVHKLISDK